MKFNRYVLGVNKKATNIAVRAELDRRPILIELLNYSTKYWLHLCDLDLKHLVKFSYLESFKHRK